jgi:hypothetical protein
MRTRLGVLATAAFVGTLACAPPRHAHAGGDLLKKALWDLCATPLELVASPVTAGSTLKTNMDVAGYRTATRVALGPPSFLWLWMNQIGMGAGRGMGAALELPLGLVALPTRWNPEPLIDLSHESVMVEGPPRFGIYFARRE